MSSERSAHFRQDAFLEPHRVEWRQNVVEQLMEVGQSPPSGDAVLSAYGYAAAEEVATGELGVVIDEALNFRPDLLPRDCEKLLLRALQKQLLRATTSDYPTDPNFEQPAFWQVAIRAVLADEDMRAELEYDIWLRNVQSNIAGRYAAHKLIMLSEVDRFGPAPQLLDIGTSDMQGPTKLAINHPFEEIEVVNPYPVSSPSLWPTDNLITPLINRMLARPMQLGQSVATDIMPVRSSKNPSVHSRAEAEWIYACSFRGKEFTNSSRAHEFRTLHSATVKDISFYQGAFSREGMELFAEQSPIQQFDLVSLTTVMYLMSPEERYEARELARQYTKPDGLIVIQDFARPAVDDPTKCQFYPEWGAYTYRTLIEDPSEKTGKLHEIFLAEDGRWRRIALGPDIGQLALGHAMEMFGTYSSLDYEDI